MKKTLFTLLAVCFTITANAGVHCVPYGDVNNHTLYHLTPDIQTTSLYVKGVDDDGVVTEDSRCVFYTDEEFTFSGYKYKDLSENEYYWIIPNASTHKYQKGVDDPENMKKYGQEHIVFVEKN